MSHQRTVKFSVRSCLFACVSCPFLMPWMPSVSGDICFVQSCQLAIFGHVQNFEWTPLDKYVRWMNVTHALVCGLASSRAVCPVLMRLASCRYPLCIHWSALPEFRTVNYRTDNRVPGYVPHAHSVIVQRTFCLNLIRCIFVLSVLHLLHVC